MFRDTDTENGTEIELSDDEVIARVCAYLLRHDRIPYTCWGVIRNLSLWQWQSLRPFVGREN